MEDGKWLRLITLGLVLAAMAVGYFLLAQRFTGTKSQQVVVETVPSPQPTPAPSVLGTNSGQAPAPSGARQDTKSAYQSIVERTKGGVSELPATGFPTLLVGMFSLGVAVAGWGLRKFPH